MENLVQISGIRSVEQFVAQRNVVPFNILSDSGRLILPKGQRISITLFQSALNKLPSVGCVLASDLADFHKNLRAINFQSEADAADNIVSTKSISELSDICSEIFDDLKKTSFTELHNTRIRKQVGNFIDEFSQRTDSLTGALNISTSFLKNGSAEDVVVAVKRATVAMAMKIRNVFQYISEPPIRRSVENVVTAALISEIGKLRAVATGAISSVTRAAFPLYSYLMIAPEKSIDFNIKKLVLNQGRILFDNEESNNFPDMNWLVPTLYKMASRMQNTGRPNIANDIRRQISAFKEFVTYQDDINIIALADMYSKLTTDSNNGPALAPDVAIRLMINCSFCTFAARSVRSFLSHLASSLCNNQPVFKVDDLLIVASASASSARRFIFEVVKVVDVKKNTYAPVVSRQGTINFEPQRKFGRLYFSYDAKTFKRDSRQVLIDLHVDISRQIMYLADHVTDSSLFDSIRPKQVRVLQKITLDIPKVS